MNTTPFSPPGYATASASLGCLIGQISERLYTDKTSAQSEQQLSSELFQKVEQWRRELPPHLSLQSTVAPSFARATFYLGLKYNYACMLIGRPYLTHSVLCSNTHDAVFSSRLEICQRANRDSIDILQKLHKQELFASSLYFDTYIILTTALILYIRSIKNPNLREDLQSFLLILKTCHWSKVGQYAVDHVEKYLRSVQATTVVETNITNVSSFPHQSSNMNQDWAMSCIGDSSYPSLNEINLNDLEDNLNLPLEYFDVDQDFNLHFCNTSKSLN